ncbi:MAG TPA: hypothetical protein VFB58_13280 [Chloroflexota bacterium]|nr:hypothetical protein [Chloroflexota bacterium]
MPWPTPQDYNEAIQHPRRAFADSVLAGGTPELTPLGLPRPVTGNFASVYRMHCGSTDWAVRCFFRPADDLATRYASIGAALDRAGLAYTVGFSYLERGIQVRGNWFPVLKMEWVEGELLSEWIAGRLADGRALRDLAKRWRAMMDALEAAGIAHGDLQHGNVLIVRGEIRLVDYDGMQVPGATYPNREIGHPNFQHPRRDATHTGPALDRFSSWLIYMSLLALADAPDLWDGDECLILKGGDLRNPAQSATLARLRRHPAGTCRALAVQIEHLLSLPPDRLPPLADLAIPPAPPPVPTWLNDYLPRPPTFSVRTPHRLAVAGLVLLTVILAALGPPAAALLAAVSTLLALLAFYTLDPAMLSRVRLLMRVYVRQRRHLQVTARLERLETVRHRLEAQQEGELVRAARRRSALHRSRFPARYRSWRVARVDRRINASLTRHRDATALLEAETASLSAREAACRQALARSRQALASYDQINVRAFLRALTGLD